MNIISSNYHMIKTKAYSKLIIYVRICKIIIWYNDCIFQIRYYYQLGKWSQMNYVELHGFIKKWQESQGSIKKVSFFNLWYEDQD